MRWFTLIAAVVALLFAGAGPDAAGQTALDLYMETPPDPDPSFHWELDSTIPGTGYTGYVLNMTSQTWRSPAEVDRTDWQHWVTVIVPDGPVIDTALLAIGGGNNHSYPPTSVDSVLADGAKATNSVVVELPTVPNQPLEFFGDGEDRREDEIIAYSYDKYLNGGDEFWPALLPMVKSAVRAMDAVQSFVPAQTGGAVEVNNFVVTGESKRGWTTWLTAAVDSPRVSGIIPIVIDVLNIDEQMVHHKAVYEGYDHYIVGGYSEAIEDYVEYDIPDNMHTPEAQALLGIVDPYEYRDRYADMPKYVLNATGDEFFVPDSAQFYYHDLPGEKHLRYYPNSGHGISGVEADAFQYYQAIVEGTEMPEFSWTVEAGGSAIRVTTVDTPLEVNLWQATNTESRDFRVGYGAAPTWTSSPLSGIGGEYLAQVPFPETGASAFMIELLFPGDAKDSPYVFTTEVSVIAPYDLLGDTDFDCDVDFTDFNNLANNYTGDTGTWKTWNQGDFDFDGDVDFDDFNTLANHYTGSGPGCKGTPEPSTLVLLSIGAVGVLAYALRRRRPAA